ncbi:BON1-associated protein 2 [Linum perenne]
MSKSRILEFTILSAEDLRLDGKSIKRNAFALVRTDQSNSKSTSADSDGGSYPRWNDKLSVELPARAQSVTVEVQCKVGSGNRVIGTAIVPVSDFLGGLTTPENYIHFLSYRLRDPRGVKNGIVNISVVASSGGGGGGVGDYGCSVAARKKEARGFGGNYGSGYSASPSWMTTSSSSWGMPVARDMNGYGGEGVVIGVPVWGAHRS